MVPISNQNTIILYGFRFEGLFSKIRWCVTHNCPILPDQPDYIDGCVAEGAWWWDDTEKGNDLCVFIDRLIEV